MTFDYDEGVKAERERIIKLLETERKKFVFNSSHAFILDEMVKLIKGRSE